MTYAGSQASYPLDSIAAPILIIGAAYTGKSQLAHRCLQAAGRTAVIGTADLSEGLLAARVEELRRERPAHWEHFEGSMELGRQLRALSPHYEQILLDSINQWVANLMLQQLHKYSLEQLTQMIELEAKELVDAVSASHARLVLVSSEVGAGITPPKPIARAFRQLVSRINCRVAAASATVLQVSVGIPLMIKGEIPSEWGLPKQAHEAAENKSHS
jgi:adenosylcobinamide kinase/adenosylcobinamide-phosphate guanylyltransferase